MNYSPYFKRIERDNKDFCYILKDESPQQLKELVKEIHFALGAGLPNDWIYDNIHSAFTFIQDEGNDIEGYICEGDVYHNDLIEWLGNGFALELCEEARREYGNDNMNLIEQIQHGQVQGLNKIYAMVNDFINENPRE